jgi:hypothetical protein
MNEADQKECVFVAGTSSFTIRLGSGSSSQRMSVTITLDERTEWTYEHASWRSLAFGYGHGAGYIWSARALVVLPRGEADPNVIDVDEDLLRVFKTESGWLLVCETSVRLITGQEETSRIEASDVIERARWSDGYLIIEDARGVTTKLTVTESRLTF